MSIAATQNCYLVTDTKHNNDSLHTTTIVVWEPTLDRAVPVARMHHDRMDARAYTDFFLNFFSTLEEDRVDVIQFIKNLEGALFDFSTAEANGLLNALTNHLGEDEARRKFDSIIRGCFVHWLRSAERVAKLVCNDEEELEEFRKQCAVMPRKMTDEGAAHAWFDYITQLYPGLYNWSKWWTSDAKGLHLRMLLAIQMWLSPFITHTA